MLLLISDANILIDLEAGELLDLLFQLPMMFAMPDVLYWEEIEPGTPGLVERGLRIMELTGEYVQFAAGLPAKHGNVPSRNDYLALALAKQEACPLLTGDRALQIAARAEEVQVMGNVWLLRCLIENCLVSVDEALGALGRMRERGRRLPWMEAERILNELRRS